MLITLSACASTSTKNDDSLQLMDGSNLFIDNGKVVKITDKTGKPISIEKRRMLELANGDFIYIRKDGSINKLKTSNNSDGHNSKSSTGGHSH